MNDPLSTVARLLTEVILPNLQSVQASQAEQIAANDRLEQAIEELRMHLSAQFAQLAAQLTACRVELAATQAALKAVQNRNALRMPDRPTLVN